MLPFIYFSCFASCCILDAGAASLKPAAAYQADTRLEPKDSQISRVVHSLLDAIRQTPAVVSNQQSKM